MPPRTSPQQHGSPELLTVSQVAELLGVSPRLVWLLAEQHELPPVRIRRCTRWRRADVLRYIDGLATPQPDKHPDAADQERTVANARR